MFPFVVGVRDPISENSCAFENVSLVDEIQDLSEIRTAELNFVVLLKL